MPSTSFPSRTGGLDAAAVMLAEQESALAGRRWQSRAEWAVVASIVLCVLDGAIRKWVLRDEEGWSKYLPYFAKDIVFASILLMPIIGKAADHAIRGWNSLRLGLIICGIGVLASIAFNVSSLNPVGAVLSVRSLFWLPLCAMFVSRRLRKVSLPKIAWAIGALVFLNAALGTLQYSRSRDDPLNYYASKQYEAVMFEESVRAMGTFPYITGFGTLAMVGAWAGTVLMSYGEGRKRVFAGGIVIVAASLWCALLSISRAPTIIVIGILTAWVFSSRKVFQNLLRLSIFTLLLIVMLFAIGRASLIERATETLLARNEAAEDIEQRITPPVAEVAQLIGLVPLGAGFGSEQVAGVFAETGVMSFRQFESQFSRIVMETGALGLVGFLMVSTALCVEFYRAQRKALDPAVRRSIITGTVLIVWLLYSNVIFDHVASFFVWAIASLLLAKAEGSVAPPPAALSVA
jgi:hypothetical protein